MAGPSRAWYAVAVLVAAAGIAGAIFFGLSAAREVDAPVERFVSGEPTVVELEGGEERTIYHQVEGVETPADPGTAEQIGSSLDCTVRGPDGAAVPTSTSGNLTLTLGEDRFVAERDFEARRPGAHRVLCRSPESSPGRLALAVGPRIGIFGFISSIFAAIGALGLGLVLGGLIAGVTALLRHLDRKGPRSPAHRGPRARGG